MDSKESNGRRARRRGRGLVRALCGALPLAIGLSLTIAGPALAQNDPTQDQYCEEGVVNEVTGECERVGVVDPADDPGATDPGATAASAPSSAGQAQGGDDRVVGSLPFTGVDLAVLGVVALVLLGAGFLLRRLSAPREP